MRTPVRWIACALIAAGCASAEPAPGPSEPQLAPAIEEELYPAALVLDHQAQLELDDAQVQAIRTELQSTQRELVDAELALRRDREELARVLAAERVDEASAMEAAARVVEQESAIKLSHLRLLVRIKNHLTPAQQQRLDALRR